MKAEHHLYTSEDFFVQTKSQFSLWTLHLGFVCAIDIYVNIVQKRILLDSYVKS